MMKKLTGIFTIGLLAIVIASCAQPGLGQSVQPTTKPGTEQIPDATLQTSPTPAISTPIPGGSGIAGKVLIGPTCPVQPAESNQCNDRPYQADISILNQKGQVIDRVKSDTQGNFLVYLAPGTYVLQPGSTKIYPRGAQVTVQVLQGQLVQVTIRFDSGIR
jgi:PBP1b-binding outer membrane lipoprotein LpoB